MKHLTPLELGTLLLKPMAEENRWSIREREAIGQIAIDYATQCVAHAVHEMLRKPNTQDELREAAAKANMDYAFRKSRDPD